MALQASRPLAHGLDVTDGQQPQVDKAQNRGRWHFRGPGLSGQEPPPARALKPLPPPWYRMFRQWRQKRMSRLCHPAKACQSLAASTSSLDPSLAPHGPQSNRFYSPRHRPGLAAHRNIEFKASMWWTPLPSTAARVRTSTFHTFFLPVSHCTTGPQLSSSQTSEARWYYYLSLSKVL